MCLRFVFLASVFCLFARSYIYIPYDVQVYLTKSALHPQVGEHYNSSINGTSRLTFAYRPVSWRL